MSSLSALNVAKDRGLDLVEIHDKSDPPICKVMDYGKWKFENKKKEKQNKKNQSKVLIKEIQMRPRTDEGDIKIKLEKAREFLKMGHKVKINLRFFGREMAHKELGFKLLKKVEDRLADTASPEMPAKMERRTLFTILTPLAGGNKKKSAEKSPSKTAESLEQKQANQTVPVESLNKKPVQAKPDEAKNKKADQAKSDEGVNKKPDQAVSAENASK